MWQFWEIAFSSFGKYIGLLFFLFVYFLLKDANCKYKLKREAINKKIIAKPQLLTNWEKKNIVKIPISNSDGVWCSESIFFFAGGIFEIS